METRIRIRNEENGMRGESKIESKKERKMNNGS